jgi:hypothetical protein
VTEAWSRLTRTQYTGDQRTRLMERTNCFIKVEATSWELATFDGGYTGTVPYLVRYEAARWLWSPLIAGTVFCLRCGTTIRYKRPGRDSGPRRRTVPVCDRCLRSSSGWPSHALMPHERGHGGSAATTVIAPSPGPVRDESVPIATRRESLRRNDGGLGRKLGRNRTGSWPG